VSRSYTDELLTLEAFDLCELVEEEFAFEEVGVGGVSDLVRGKVLQQNDSVTVV
jgi:hypothetical protein